MYCKFLVFLGLIVHTTADCFDEYRAKEDDLKTFINCLYRSSDFKQIRKVLDHRFIYVDVYKQTDCSIIQYYYSSANHCISGDQFYLYCRLLYLYYKRSYSLMRICPITYTTEDYLKEIYDLATIAPNYLVVSQKTDNNDKFFNNNLNFSSVIASKNFQSVVILIRQFLELPYVYDFFAENANFSSIIRSSEFKNFLVYSVHSFNSSSSFFVNNSNISSILYNVISSLDYKSVNSFFVNNNFKNFFGKDYDKYSDLFHRINNFSNNVLSSLDHFVRDFRKFKDNSVSRKDIKELISVTNNTLFWRELFLGNNTSAQLKGGIFGGILDGIGEIFHGVFVSVVRPILNEIGDVLLETFTFSADFVVAAVVKLLNWLFSIISEIFLVLDKNLYIIEASVLIVPIVFILRDLYSSVFVYCLLLLLFGTK